MRTHKTCLFESLENRRLLSTTFTNADLSDTWNLAGMRQFGDVQFDGAGNITGGSVTQADGSTVTPSGIINVSVGGLVTKPDDPEFFGAMNISKDAVAFT